MTTRDDIAIDFRFSTPICKMPLKGFEDHASGLVDCVQALRSTSAGIQSSNYNGWHSGRSLHVRPADEHLRWLVRRVSVMAIRSLQKLMGDPSVNIRLREFWANLNEAGGWNVPHHHGGARWSGVVYVAGDSAPASADRHFGVADGDTIFLNPTPQSTYFGQPTSINYRAEVGSMLMFPGYLTHMVVPHGGADRRITFAFNIDMVKAASDAKRQAAPIPPEQTQPRVKLMS